MIKQKSNIKIILSIVAIGLWTHTTFAQTSFSNAGSLIHIQDDALVTVEGNLLNKDNNNNDPGTFENQGELRVSGNWEHNASNKVFSDSSTGFVLLNGNDQFVVGNAITEFPSLRFEGDGTIKSFEVDASVRDTLDLANAEAATNNNILSLLNPAVEALKYSQGFISSEIIAGYFERRTSSSNSYVIPLGSNLIPNILRPVVLMPNSNDTNSYLLRLAPIDADIEDVGPSFSGLSGPFDRSKNQGNFKEFNDQYYYNIVHKSGASETDYELHFFDIDGDFDRCAEWSANDDQWQKVNNTQLASSTLSGISVLPDQKITINSQDLASEAIILGVNESALFTEFITPNGDGSNDVFVIFGAEDRDNDELIIFNRWGTPVHKSIGYFNDWDAVPTTGLIVFENQTQYLGRVPPGAYYFQYKRDVEDKDVLVTGYFHIQY
ncbi:MAG: gliding motility-associated C-terminal domain-containing protein [Flavobacteriales bacterium]|nr:gliding motility-associated C-terminal domain-containing protein [Flavobacteriales bacterium]